MIKNKNLVIIVLVLLIGAAAVLVMRGNRQNSTAPAKIATGTLTSDTATSVPRVPAYQSAEKIQHLAKTLEPSEFFGKAREAYLVAQKIPQTLAQLPCYCHCDQSFGHKSLHTCFEDDHASHCAVCVDEALLAYQLQNEEKLTPEQVRQRIIEKYSSGHGHSH